MLVMKELRKSGPHATEGRIGFPGRPGFMQGPASWQSKIFITATIDSTSTHLPSFARTSGEQILRNRKKQITR